MKINPKYFEDSFIEESNQLKSILQSMEGQFSAVPLPDDFEYAGLLSKIEENITNAMNSCDSLVSKVEEILQAYNAAENTAKALR